MASAPRTPAADTKKSGNATLPAIHGNMRVSEVIAILPEAGSLLAGYGLQCVGCVANSYETLAEGWMGHGYPEEEFQDLITDLNELMQNRPERPQTLSLSKEAAVQLGAILASQNQPDSVLMVSVDESGAFCLEFVDDAGADMFIVSHPDVPGVRVGAIPVTLSRIGGAGIDFRDGRFKLDLPEDAAAKGCACAGGECGCK